jgi:Tfp pilus assembly protein PilF
VTNEILRIDPKSKPALAVAYTALKAANRANEATDMLLRLVGADPSNTKNVEAVVNELAGSGQASKAIPFVDQLVRDNPGDPNYLSLQMRVHLAAKDYKGGIAAGEELLKSDTAAATPELFTRLAAAAAIDSQPQKASALMAQAVAKFPTNSDLLSSYADILRTAGQTQQALDVLNRAISANPKASGLLVTRARILADLNQPDSAVATLQKALAAGESAENVGRYALGIGQQLSRAANGTKKLEDYKRAVDVLDFANKTYQMPDGSSAFLLGATAFQMGTAWLQEAQRLSKLGKSETANACTASKNAQAAFAITQVQMPSGGKFNPQVAQQILTGLGQMSGYADQFAKAFCK